MLRVCTDMDWYDQGKMDALLGKKMDPKLKSNRVYQIGYELNFGKTIDRMVKEA